MNRQAKARQYEWLAEMYRYHAKAKLAERDLWNALVAMHGMARTTAESTWWRLFA